MRAFLPTFIGATLTVLATVRPASGESATFGWQTTTGRSSYVTDVYMLGPTARNKPAEKKGVFKGEFLSRAGQWQSRLIAVYKLSVTTNAELQLQSRKVQFTAYPVSNAEEVVTNGWKGVKLHFATESLSFEPEELFLLVFKSKLGYDPAEESTETVAVRIVRLFVPS